MGARHKGKHKAIPSSVQELEQDANGKPFRPYNIAESLYLHPAQSGTMAIQIITGSQGTDMAT